MSQVFVFSFQKSIFIKKIISFLERFSFDIDSESASQEQYRFSEMQWNGIIPILSKIDDHLEVSLLD